MDLAYAPKQGYRANGRWVMNRKTEAAIRKFKDSAGNYVWQPGDAAGQPATVFGYPVTEAEDMPDIAANSLFDCLRRFRPRLSDRRPGRHPGVARSLFVEALCAVLYDETGRRRRAGFRRDQIDEVCGFLIWVSSRKRRC